jgi:hypothetical protein
MFVDTFNILEICTVYLRASYYTHSQRCYFPKQISAVGLCNSDWLRNLTAGVEFLKVI